MNQEERSSSLLGPTLGTIVFVTVVPGTVIGLIPYELSGWRLAEIWNNGATRWESPGGEQTAIVTPDGEIHVLPA